MPKIIQGTYRIISSRRRGPDFFKLKLYAPSIAKAASPGQFVNIRVSKNLNPLLRRPFSFHNIGQKDFEILYKVVGEGTKLLSERRKGDYIDLLGPLGNGFDLKIYPLNAIRCPLIVAGGMGVAPLVALAKELKDRKPMVLLGAKSAKDIVCIKDFQRLGCAVRVATDNGSLGFKGPVSELLKKIIRNARYATRDTTVFACGPKPMLKEIAGVCRKQDITVYGSLEEYMACGVGACLSCAVWLCGQKLPVRACREGPVFNLHEVDWR